MNYFIHFYIKLVVAIRDEGTGVRIIKSGRGRKNSKNLVIEDIETSILERKLIGDMFSLIKNSMGIKNL